MLLNADLVAQAAALARSIGDWKYSVCVVAADGSRLEYTGFVPRSTASPTVATATDAAVPAPTQPPQDGVTGELAAQAVARRQARNRAARARYRARCKQVQQDRDKLLATNGKQRTALQERYGRIQELQQTLEDLLARAVDVPSAPAARSAARARPFCRRRPELCAAQTAGRRAL